MKKVDYVIRSTKHYLKDANIEKSLLYIDFVNEYSRVCKLMVDHIWDNLPEDLSVDRFVDYNIFNITTDLSARVQQNAVMQASGIIRASIEKQRRRLWVRQNRNPNVKDVKFSKPKLNFVAPQLNANCADFQLSTGKFYGFLKLKSLGKKYGSFNLPVVHSPRIRGERCNSFKLFKNILQLSWKHPHKPSPKGEKILNIDQGKSTVATLSDGQVTPVECPHGHSMNSILEKMARSRKGSKGFKRAQAHRLNFVNWSINQLNFSEVKEVRLEKVVNIRLGKKCSRVMQHWSNPEIRDKIKHRCEELEVPFSEYACAYRSQRCNSCGLVRKANRNGKVYTCNNCGYTGDADFNAALNGDPELPPVRRALLGLKLNRGRGFFWQREGFFTWGGEELLVPHGADSKSDE